MSQINHNHILSLMQTGFTTINVTFDNNLTDADWSNRASNRNRQVKGYTYKALVEDNIQPGDTVIVESPQEGLVLVTVMSVDATPKIDLSAAFPYKWIVQKVNRARYDELLRQEDEFKEALVEVEREKQRETVLRDFQERLPEGSKARQMFDATINKAKVLPHVADGN